MLSGSIGPERQPLPAYLMDHPEGYLRIFQDHISVQVCLRFLETLAVVGMWDHNFGKHS